MMKKIWLCCILLLAGCQKEVKQKAPVPSAHDVGKVCTYIVGFEDHTYNISLYYQINDEFLLKNADEFNVIDEISLRYSTQGKKDVNRYGIDEKKVYAQCGLNHANVVATALEINEKDMDMLIADLKRQQFYVQVEQQHEIYQVKMPNTVYFASELETNYEKVHAQHIDVQQYETLCIEKKLISSEEEIFGEITYGKLISNEHDWTIPIHVQFDDFGELYQYQLTLFPKEGITTSMMPIVTLAIFDKEDVHEHSYVDIEDGVKMSMLMPYILAETEDRVMVDLTPLLYGCEDEEDVVQLSGVLALDQNKVMMMREELVQKITAVFMSGAKL